MTNTQAVPRFHRDGWTPGVQSVFLETLTAIGSVREAARRCGRTASSAYRRRARAGGDGFRDAWAAALEVCLEGVRETAVDRAFNGQLMPVYQNGIQIGEQRVFNDRMLIALMRLYDAPAYHADRARDGLPTRDDETIDTRDSVSKESPNSGMTEADLALTGSSPLILGEVGGRTLLDGASLDFARDERITGLDLEAKEISESRFASSCSAPTDAADDGVPSRFGEAIDTRDSVSKESPNTDAARHSQRPNRRFAQPRCRAGRHRRTAVRLDIRAATVRPASGGHRRLGKARHNPPTDRRLAIGKVDRGG